MQMQVEITAILKDPDGVWQDTAEVGGPNEAPVNAVILQILSALRNNGGLVTFTNGGKTAEYIPMDRVKNITLTARDVSIINGGGDAAIKAAASRAQATQQQTKKFHV